MNIAVLAVAGIASALAAQLIRKTNPEISSVLTIGTGVLIAAAVVAQILPVTTQIQIFLDRADWEIFSSSAASEKLMVLTTARK